MSQEYSFKVLDIRCGTVAQKIDVARVGGWLILAGSVNIPDPCFSLLALTEVNPDKQLLKVLIKAIRVKKICIKCMASAKFELRYNIYALRAKGIRGNKLHVKVEYYLRGRQEILFDQEVNISL